ITSIIYAAVMAFVIDRKFKHAAVWLGSAAICSAVGLIHAYRLSPSGVENHFAWFTAAPGFAMVYAAGAVILWFIGMSDSGDAVGFLVGQVYPSRSAFISAEAAARIAAKLPPFCSTVLVTHLSRPSAVVRAARTARVTTIQLHGETQPDEAAAIRRSLPYVKV